MWFKRHKHNCKDVIDIVVCVGCGTIVERWRAETREIWTSYDGKRKDTYCKSCVPAWDYARQNSFTGWTYWKRRSDLEVDENGKPKYLMGMYRSGNTATIGGECPPPPSLIETTPLPKEPPHKPASTGGRKRANLKPTPPPPGKIERKKRTK